MIVTTLNLEEQKWTDWTKKLEGGDTMKLERDIRGGPHRVSYGIVSWHFEGDLVLQTGKKLELE